MKYILIIFLYGLFYYFFESLFNAIFTKQVFKEDNKQFRGWCSIYMFIIGILIGTGIWGLFYIPLFRVNVYFFILITAIHIVISELLFGYLLDKIFKLRLWNYSNEILNFKGYISLPRSIGWSALSVFIYYFNCFIWKAIY